MQTKLIDRVVNHLLKAEADERESEAMAFRKIVTRNERKFAWSLRRLFAQQKREVLSKLDSMKDMTDLFMFDSAIWDRNLRIISTKHMKAAMNENGLRVFRDIAKMGKQYKDLTAEIDYDMEYPEAMLQLEAQTLKLAGEVNATTELAVRTAIMEGFVEGLTIREIAKNIEKVFKQAGAVRAAMIARTEMSRAANYGAIVAYQQSGVVEAKEWLTAKDEKVCPFCNKMDGKVISLEESFLPVGQALESVDQSTFATSIMMNNYANVDAPPLHVNCRCTILPVVKEFIVEKPELDFVASGFGNEKDSLEYAKRKMEYDKWMINNGVTPTSKRLNRKFMKEFYNKEFPESLDMLEWWQGSTNSIKAMAFRAQNTKLEKGDIDKLIWMKKGVHKEEVLENFETLLPKDDYIGMRAFNQAYMEAKGIDDIVLYRGIGTDFGKKMREDLEAQSVKVLKTPIKDRQISGYTDSEKVAVAFGSRFGSTLGGVTMRQIYPISDIVIHKDLLGGITGEKVTEFEYIVKSGLKKINKKDLLYGEQIEFGK